MGLAPAQGLSGRGMFLLLAALNQHAGSSHAPGAQRRARALSHPLFSLKDGQTFHCLHKAPAPRGAGWFAVGARALPAAGITPAAQKSPLSRGI